MRITVDFVLSLTWFDRRLSFRHLKRSFALNVLSLQEMKTLWFPEVTLKPGFKNGQN